MSKPTRHLLRVIKGGFAPADDLTAARLRKVMKVGDEVFVELKKPRNPKFHRLTHQFAALLIDNTDAFGHYTDPHAVLKRLQWEANAGCDELAVDVPGIGLMSVRTPRSLSFESMCEDEFQAVYAQMCAHAGAKYFGGLPAEEVAHMAELMRDAA